MMKYNLEERKERARMLRNDGYNCSQCVVLAFDDLTGVDSGLIARISSGFGSGYGGRGEVCGAVSGATMVSGLSYDLERPALYGKVKGVMSEFERMNGSCICRELKQPGRSPCIDLITAAVEILHRKFEADGR